MTNVVDTLDGALKLCAPMIVRWMKENPSFEGIDVRFDFDEPVACPKDRQGRWYDAPEFEASAAAELKDLHGAVRALAAACPVSRGSLRPLHLSSWRHEKVVVYVKMMQGLGGFRAERDAVETDDGVLACTPAAFILSTDVQPSAEQVEALKAAAAEGPEAALRHMVETGTIRHWSSKQGEEAARWFAAFPEPVGATVSDRFGLLHDVRIESNQEPAMILLPRRLLDERADLEPLLRDRGIAFEVFDEPAAPSAAAAPAPK